jgi:purine-binding chemotaxis protein CheW
MTTEQIHESTGLDDHHQADLNQYLSFFIAGEEYGVDILRVQEIKGWDAVTEIPNTPDHIQGVINLRGTIVPVVDMRKRFELDSIDYGETTVIIVLRIIGEKGERIMGFVVDAVSDVYNVQKDQLQPPPDFGTVVSIDFIRGMATVNEKMVILLDMDKLVEADVAVAAPESVH